MTVTGWPGLRPATHGDQGVYLLLERQPDARPGQPKTTS